jgi:hypothetical protein
MDIVSQLHGVVNLARDGLSGTETGGWYESPTFEFGLELADGLRDNPTQPI